MTKIEIALPICVLGCKGCGYIYMAQSPDFGTVRRCMLMDKTMDLPWGDVMKLLNAYISKL